MAIDDDISTTDALNMLRRAERDPGVMNRRRFLGMVGAGFGASLVSGSLLHSDFLGLDPSAWAAGPLADDQRVLILIGMWGGNDGLNTLVPFTDPLYYAQRPKLAIAEGSTIDLDGEYGLNPALTALKSFWDADKLAVVQGVGYPNPNLSHFDSMAKWMSGRPDGPVTSGWAGRWLDEYLNGQKDLYAGVEVGGALSLLLQGESTRGTALPAGRPTFGVDPSVRAQRLYASMRNLNPGDASWKGRIGAAIEDHLDLAATVAPAIPQAIPAPAIAAQLEMIGHLVNANLGFRILTTGWNDFDSHANQLASHPAKMSELNAGIQRLYQVLSPAWAARVTVMTYSEFGRTSWENDGDGTDHGTANVHFVIGDDIKGGFYGQRPSLAGLGRWDRMAYHVDYRDYFGSVIDGCLGGGGSEAFDDRPVQDLGLFKVAVPPPTTTTVVPPPDTTTTAPPETTTPPPAPEPAGSSFVALDPVRIYDTRQGLGGHSGRLAQGEKVNVQVAGMGGVPPTGARSVVLNVTAVNATEETNFRVFPAGIPVPYASNLNPQPNRAVPNMVMVGVGAGGAIGVFNERGQADCIVDVMGYFGDGDGADLMPVVPARVLDTRSGVGTPMGQVSGGSIVELQVTGRGGVPAADVEAVVLNVGSVTPTADGYVTVWAAGTAQPGVSNLNYTTGQNIPNLVICKVGSGGKIHLFASSGSVHLIGDVVGYFSSNAGSRHVAVPPTRLLDTRAGIGASVARIPAGGEVLLQVAGRGGVPANATAAVINVTAVGASDNTYVTVYPDGVARPEASTLNVTAATTIANLAAVKLGENGNVRLFNFGGSLDLIADVSGYFL